MPGAPFKIVVAEAYPSSALDRLRRLGEVRELSECGEAALIDAVKECDALLVRTASKVTRRVIEASTRLRVIGRAGVGLDNIDVAAAEDRRIQLVYTPHAATEAVADLTFALILGLTWNLRAWDACVREGNFQAGRSALLARELAGLRLGIIGMGRIGKAVGRRAIHGFLMEVVYHDLIDWGTSLGIAARRVEKEDLVCNSDIVSLHVPLTELTRGMVGADEFAFMRNTAILINTSRGPVVDSVALGAALRSGQIAGAGIDVFDPEPLPSCHPLLSAPQTLFTPHTGSRTALAQERMFAVVDDVARVLEGGKPRYPAFPAPSA